MRLAVPAEQAPEGEVVRFAQSYDGYAAHGGVPELGAVVAPVHAHWKATGELTDAVELLRACLFFAVRAHRFTRTAEPFTADPFVLALLARLRSVAVAGVELDTRIGGPGHRHPHE